jgi:uncharacterized iron-regulated protein
MPAVSKKQERFMQAVAHNPKFAKAAGVPQSVGKEFTKSGGGMAKANPFMEMIAKKKAAAGKPMKKMASGGMTSMGKVKTAAPSRDGVAVQGKTKGTMVKMAGNKGMKSGGKC